MTYKPGRTSKIIDEEIRRQKAVEADYKKKQRKKLLEEQCSNCIYFHRLKHNFTREKGFEESYCCDMLLHDPEPGEPWVQEVSPTDMCEMFTPKRRRL